RTDKFEEINKPRRYIEDINVYTGMTEKEIYDDLEERKQILNWMVRQKYFDILQISEVAKAYYNTPDVLYRAVEKDKELEGVPKPKHLFEAPTLSTFKAVSNEEINVKEESKPISLSKIPEVEFSASEVLKTLTEEIEKAKAEKRSKKPKGKKR
ncbi:MAG: hypothetical protein QXZ69_00645, partial [Candidatus Micrarchaeia archaeon]